MTETFFGEPKDEEGPLGSIGKLVAKRWAQQDLEYEKLIARQNRPAVTDAALARLQRDRSRILELDELRRKREQQIPLSAGNEYDPDDAVPKWMRDRWADKAGAVGSTALVVPPAEQITVDVQLGVDGGQE